MSSSHIKNNKVLKTFLLSFLYIILSVQSYAQTSGWDTVLFVKHMEGVNNKTVNWVGDQNGDGKDDILLYDCFLGKLSLYLGGNPMDTIPVWEVNIKPHRIISADINNDGIRDIILSGNGSIAGDGLARIYYGGIPIDTVPQIIFTPKGQLEFVLKDFDGDGKEDIISWYGGEFFRYKVYPQIDTIPQYFLQRNFVEGIYYYPTSFTHGDINGDGKTDVLIYGIKEATPENRVFMSLYLGNENWTMEPEFSYYNDEHLFNATDWRIIKDVNKDGRDDVLIPDYAEFYPYYYNNAIIYGKIPLDTIPNIGLNVQNSGISPVNFVSEDINGDGYNDLIARINTGGAAEARLWVGGNPMPELPKKYWYFNWLTNPPEGPILGKVGDLDGDGMNEICIGIGSFTGQSCINGVIIIFKGDTSYSQLTSVEDDDNLNLNDYYLYEPYPNPFNGSTVISYQLTVGSDIKITVYDMLGREVTTLVDKYENAGKHHVEFDASKYSSTGGLSSGIYFVQLKIMGTHSFEKGNGVQQKKIVYLK